MLWQIFSELRLCLSHFRIFSFIRKYLNVVSFALCRNIRGKSKPEQLPCEQFLQQIKISRAFLRAKQVGEKRGKFQFVVEIAHKALIQILLSL